MAQTYTIGQLATAAAVGVETIRYYQRRKLIREPARPLRGTRRYTDADAERLRFITRAQVMGFALNEIKTLLDPRARGLCSTARDLAVAKLEFVDVRIRELGELRKELAALVAECNANRDDSACPIVHRLASSGTKSGR
jgi:MerR family mercuric resistance operon transcriptional regulator